MRGDGCDDITCNREKRRVPERDQPGIADKDIQTEREQRERQDFDDQSLNEYRQPQKRRGRKRGQQNGQRNPDQRRSRSALTPFQGDINGAHSTSSSSRPPARMSSTTAIRPKMM